MKSTSAPMLPGWTSCWLTTTSLPLKAEEADRLALQSPQPIKIIRTAGRCRRGSHHPLLAQCESTVITALESCSPSALVSELRLTSQKSFCGSKHSMPARSSLGPSCRTHAILNFALCDPRRKLMVIPASNRVRRPPNWAPVSVMSTVCTGSVLVPIEIFTGRTVLIRGDLRLFNTAKQLSWETRAHKSYLGYRPDRILQTRIV